jgi:2-methylcitrate dehydratase PrpD
LIRACKGFMREPERIIFGGPMTGEAIAHLDEQTIRAPEITALMARVEMCEADDLLIATEEEANFPEAARVIVTTNDGQRLSRTVRAATGMPNNRADDAWLGEKFRRNAAASLSTSAVAALESKIWSIGTNPEASCSLRAARHEFHRKRYPRRARLFRAAAPE